METSNFELMDLCKKLKIPLRGVYCKDELDDLTKKTGYFIINMMDEKDVSKPNVVGHWVAFYKSKDCGVYFDSFGMPPPNDIINYINQKNLKRVYYNTSQIQHINDDYCGYICVWFLYWMKSHNKTAETELQEFVNLFNYTDIKKNKQIVKKWFKLK